MEDSCVIHGSSFWLLGTFQNFHESTMWAVFYFFIPLNHSCISQKEKKYLIFVCNLKSAHFKSAFNNKKKLWCIFRKCPWQHLSLYEKIFVVQNNESCWTLCCFCMLTFKVVGSWMNLFCWFEINKDWEFLIKQKTWKFTFK